MASQFTNILVPLDFTDKNAAAIDTCLELARQHSSRVTLLHVDEGIPGLREGEVQDIYNKLSSNARTKLEEIAERFSAENVNVETTVIVGKRGPDIVRCAVDRGVDIVILSSHKVGINDPIDNWATLSYQVSVICPCPVLLVK